MTNKPLARSMRLTFRNNDQNHMKRILLASLLFASLGVQAQTTAQPTVATKAQAEKTSPEARAEQLTAEMVKELGLNDEQATQLAGINKDHAAAMDQLNKAGLEGEAKKARAQVLADKYDGRVKALLTAEQYEKFVVMRKAKRDAAMEKRQQLQAAPSSQ